MAKAAKTTTVTITDVEKAKIVGIEAQLVAKYGDKIVPGSVRRAPEGSKYGRKMLVDIRTRGLDGEFDGNTRTVATSDVFQVHHTEEVAVEMKKVRAAEKRAAKKSDEPAKAAPAKRTRKSKAKASTTDEADVKVDEAAAALGVD